MRKAALMEAVGCTIAVGQEAKTENRAKSEAAPLTADSPEGGKPTMLLVNSAGVVTGAWLGEVQSGDQEQVLAALKKG